MINSLGSLPHTDGHTDMHVVTADFPDLGNFHQSVGHAEDPVTRPFALVAQQQHVPAGETVLLDFD